MENIESLKERLKNKHKYEKNHVESIDILGGEEVKRHTITIYSGGIQYTVVFLYGRIKKTPITHGIICNRSLHFHNCT